MEAGITLLLTRRETDAQVVQLPWLACQGPARST